MFLSCLVFLAPLYGKRPNDAAPHVARADNLAKKAKVCQALADDFVRHALNFLRQCHPAQRGADVVDLSHEFAFVHEDFMALLMSIYPPHVLRKELQKPDVRDLDLWREFEDAYYDTHSVAEQQVVFDTYARRFSEVLLAHRPDFKASVSDDQRLLELEMTQDLYTGFLVPVLVQVFGVHMATSHGHPM